MKNHLTFIGHASIKLVTKENVVIYIDPAFPGGDYSQAADIILITHHHGDHDKVELVNKKPDCLIFDNNDFLQNGEYLNKEVLGVNIQAVQAYNKNHKIEESVGYLIDLGDKLIYVAGDTSKTQQMESLGDKGIDYAILPIDGYYNMGPQEADQSVALIKPKVFIPVHNDPRSMKDGKEYDTNFDLLKSDNVLRINHGQTIEL